MIEYYTFKHKGGDEKYDDEVFLTITPQVTIAIFYGSKNREIAESSIKTFSEILGQENAQKDFSLMADDIERKIPVNTEYLALRISDTQIDSVRRGGVSARIIKNGELKTLPNGLFGLEDEDRIVCATDNFFKQMTDEGILADGLCALSCEEWMDNMITRISDNNRLMCGNLSAVTLIVRAED